MVARIKDKKEDISLSPIADILSLGVVIPVVTVENLDEVLPLTRALLLGGIKTMEITLRTPIALEAIKMVSGEIREMKVGAGTVTSPAKFEDAVEAGADYIVSPGFTEELAKKAEESDIPFLPGVATPSEIIKASECGFKYMKFYPAEIFGGCKALKAYSSLFSDIIFCPTGGVNEDNYKDYLNLPNVTCVGGSWLVSQEIISSENWSEITRHAKKINSPI